MSRWPALVLVLVSCTGLPEADRDDIAADVSERMATEVAFAEDPAARVDQLLADGVLTADDAVRLAVCNNPRLQGILEELEIARAQVLDAALLPNPALDVELQFVEAGGGDILELALTQSIVDLLLIPIRRQVAEEHFEEVRARVTSAVIDLAIETLTTYRRLQAQLDLAALHEQSTDATWLAAEAMKRLREAGNIRELEMLVEQAGHHRSRIVLTEARARAHMLRDAMNVLLGLQGPAADRWAVDGPLPAADPLDVAASDVERRVVAASLDLEAARHELIAIGHAVGLRRLDVLLAGNRVGGKVEREPGETWSGGPVASVTLPIFDWGQAASREAKARLRRSYQRYTDTAVRLRHRARAAWVAATSAAANCAYLHDQLLPLRDEITRRTQEQFNGMQIGVVELLAARRSELATRRDHLRLLRAHWIARARLEAMLLGRMAEVRFGIDVGGPSAGFEMGPTSSPGDH